MYLGLFEVKDINDWKRDCARERNEVCEGHTLCGQLLNRAVFDRLSSTGQPTKPVWPGSTGPGAKRRDAEQCPLGCIPASLFHTAVLSRPLRIMPEARERRMDGCAGAG